MLELKNLSAGYQKTEVLHGVSVAFEKSKLTNIIGPNGCGKSTLLKAASGILPCMSGQVSVDGDNISKCKRNEVAKRIAYLSQGKSVPDMTVEQLVLHGRFPHLQYPRRYTHQDRAFAMHALEQVGISALAHQPIAALSGGMRQCAYIAMALAQDTEYILLDEPTTFLDVPHQLRLMKLLRELANCGKGIVTVMHDLPLAFHCSDTVVVMGDGRIHAAKAPNDLYADPVIQELFETQLRRDALGRFYYEYWKSD